MNTISSLFSLIKSKVQYLGSWCIHKAAIPAQKMKFDNIELDKTAEKYIGNDKVFLSKKFSVNIRGSHFIADGIISSGDKNSKKAVKIFFWPYNRCYEQHLSEMKQWHDKGYHIVSVNYLGVRESQGASVLFDDVLCLADEVVLSTKEDLNDNIPIFVRGRSFGGGPAAYMANKHNLIPIIDRSFSKYWLAARDIMIAPKLVAPVTFFLALPFGLFFAATLKWSFLSALFATKFMVLLNLIMPSVSKLIFDPITYSLLEIFSTWHIHVASEFINVTGPKLFFTAVANNIKEKLNFKQQQISNHSGSNDKSISYESSLEFALRKAGYFKDKLFSVPGWQDTIQNEDNIELDAITEDCRVYRNSQSTGDAHDISPHNLITHMFGKTMFEAEDAWCNKVIENKIQPV